MPNFIDKTFFIGEISLPNTNDIKVSERLDVFIAKYEARCLTKILGYELYKKINEVSARMSALRTGADYTNEYGIQCRWNGLFYNKNSLIANYIFWFYIASAAIQTTGVSTGTMNTQAGQSISPGEKMVSAWNFFSSEVNSMLSYLRANIGLYPEFHPNQFYITSNVARKTNILGI